MYGKASYADSHLQPGFGHGIKEIDEILVLIVRGIALRVKGGEACSVLGVFVSPERGIR